MNWLRACVTVFTGLRPWVSARNWNHLRLIADVGLVSTEIECYAGKNSRSGCDAQRSISSMRNVLLR